MADGVRIRIVGDDSEFVRTLEGLEKRTRTAFGGMGAQLPSLSRGLQGLLGGLTGRLSAAGGILSQKGAAVEAARNVAAAVRGALADEAGAYGAGAQMGEGFRLGLNGKRAAVEAAAKKIANAAIGAMRTTLDIRSPSRVTMEMGEFAGRGFEIGLTRSLQSAVRSAGRVAGEINLAPRASAAEPAVRQPAGISQGLAQPVYLNVDGRTLAQVITGDMRTSLNRQGRSVDIGRGR